MIDALIKILATALTLSQVTTNPDTVKTRFDPASDQAEVVSLLRAGCSHISTAFDIEAINLDDLITTAMDDPQALTSDITVFRGINFKDLYAGYRQFCRNETIADSPIDIAAVITFFNQAASDLPDATQFKQLKQPGTSIILDGTGKRFTEVYRPGHRRVWIPLSEIPEAVQKAFIAAEDKRFYEHKGVDERGLVRAFVANILSPGRPQGGSTITQQVAKNILVGRDVTYERKIREVIVASRLERALTKAEILELYLNSIYLGRGSWGIEMAARGYFGKKGQDLTLAEGALLASLAKGPGYFNPDKHVERLRERYAYVLNRMKEDGYIDAAAEKRLELPDRTAETYERRDTGYHFVDQIRREARSVADLASLTAASYTVHSTVNPALQRAAEAALQDGLADFEARSGRAVFEGAETNLADAIAQIGKDQAAGAQPAWQQALQAARLPRYDVHWTPAVVVQLRPGNRGDSRTQVGLSDGRTLPLVIRASSIRERLQLHDVIYVQVIEAGGRPAHARLRVKPQVQGAAAVIENKSGRILAMVGAFSYPLSQLNRVTQTRRQPGSALKPLTYLAALHRGLQPNTLVEDAPITLPPVGNSRLFLPEDYRESDRHYWTPKNFDGSFSGLLTLRQALERSRNVATAGLLTGGIDYDPERSLAKVCALAVEAKIYKECVPHYPFILGAQAVRLIDLAAFYAAIANEGAYRTPYTVESIKQREQTVYRHTAEPPHWLASGDRAAMYQLKSMLQGVVQRGTAYSLKSLAPYIAGKTGTSDDANDAWFVGFSNEVTVAVWVGYDNGDGKRRTLGGSQTGAKVAIPIFRPIMEAAWALHAPRSKLNPPSPDAKRNLVALPIDRATGTVVDQAGGGNFVEYLRRSASGQYDDAQYQIVSRYRAESLRDPPPVGDEWITGYPPGPVYRRYVDPAPEGWITLDGRRYRVEPETYSRPRRRGFLDELFGAFERRPRSYDVRPDPRYPGRPPLN